MKIIMMGAPGAGKGTQAAEVSRKFGIPATIFAFIMGFTRIYVGVHYTTDVISAAIVGIIYAIAGVIIAKYLFPIADKLIDKVLGKLFKKKKEETK